MVAPRWKTYEQQVREIAELIFGAPCKAGVIGGVRFDGIIDKSDLEKIVIEVSVEHDLEKVRQGINRLTLARTILSAESILLRGYIVLGTVPTPAMVEAAEKSKMKVCSASQFAAQFFQFSRYRSARMKASFGSSINPLTGSIDEVKYVPVAYNDVTSGRDITIAEIAELLTNGRQIILLGESWIREESVHT